MEECVRAMQQSLRETVPVKKRVKSVYNQRNLGTIKERKKEKNQEKETSSGEIILRILRMRYVSPRLAQLPTFNCFLTRHFRSFLCILQTKYARVYCATTGYHGCRPSRTGKVTSSTTAAKSTTISTGGEPLLWFARKSRSCIARVCFVLYPMGCRH